MTCRDCPRPATHGDLCRQCAEDIIRRATREMLEQQTALGNPIPKGYQAPNNQAYRPVRIK